MEQDQPTNNPIKELEASEMLNELRDGTMQQEELNDVGTKPGDVLIDQRTSTESLSVKLPSGFEFSCSSLKHDVFELGNLALQMHAALKENGQPGEKSYLK